jgi:thiol-disulfide isomerase/thioredoxin
MAPRGLEKIVFRHFSRIAASSFVTGTCLGLAVVLASGSACRGEESKLLDGSVQAILERLELPDVQGESVRLSSFLERGPIIVDFWATWCKPCLQAMPELQQLFEDLAPRGLQVVAINEDGPRSAAKVKPFLKTYGYTFPVVLDLNREAQRELQALALPTTLVLDRKGVVLHSSFGYRPGEYEKLRTLLEPHLDDAPDE